MQTFREKPALAWMLLIVALLALAVSYYLFMRPSEPAVPAATGGQPAAAPPPGGQQPASSAGQSVPY